MTHPTPAYYELESKLRGTRNEYCALVARLRRPHTVRAVVGMLVSFLF